VSTPPSEPGPTQPGGQAGPPPAARWGGLRELRTDLRSAVVLALGLALAGIPAGVLWRGLAPRADFRITEDGPVAIGSPSSELLAAVDGVFVLIVAAAGLLAGLVAWSLRRRRGVAAVLALAVGSTATALVAWQVGELLAPGPTREQLTEVGATVSTGIELGSLPALAVAPFVALLVYVLGVLVNADDSLGRRTGKAATGGEEAEQRPEPAALG
jgi:hypothetical protein